MYNTIGTQAHMMIDRSTQDNTTSTDQNEQQISADFPKSLHKITILKKRPA